MVGSAFISDYIDPKFQYPQQNPKRKVRVELPIKLQNADFAGLSYALGLPENIGVIAEFINVMTREGMVEFVIGGDLPKEFEVAEGELIPLCEMIYECVGDNQWPVFRGFRRIEETSRGG